MAFINWFGAWLLFILLLVAFAKTKAGNTIVYYLLWLAVIFLLLSHASEIAGMFSAAGIVPQGATNASTPGG